MDQNKSHCPHVGLIECMNPPRDHRHDAYWSQCRELGLYSRSSAQGCRFCSAYREELCAHSGSVTADSPRDFWRADCCSCRMSRLACWRSASLSSAVCLLEEGEEEFNLNKLIIDTLFINKKWGRMKLNRMSVEVWKFILAALAGLVIEIKIKWCQHDCKDENIYFFQAQIINIKIHVFKFLYLPGEFPLLGLFWPD